MSRPYEHHGKSSHPLYRVWNGIKRRCFDPATPMYHRYGGRGITMCREWELSFSTFLRDMGDRPTPRHQIDRINNDGDYTPENCRWLDARINAQRKGCAKYLTHDGETLSHGEWADRLGLTYAQFAGRLRLGWSMEKIMSTGRISCWRNKNEYHS